MCEIQWIVCRRWLITLTNTLWSVFMWNDTKWRKESLMRSEKGQKGQDFHIVEAEAKAASSKFQWWLITDENIAKNGNFDWKMGILARKWDFHRKDEFWLKSEFATEKWFFPMKSEVSTEKWYFPLKSEVSTETRFFPLTSEFFTHKYNPLK